MIRCLLIGKNEDIELYRNLLKSINFFGKISIQLVETDEAAVAAINPDADAVLLVSTLKNANELLSKLIRQGRKIYSIDQPFLSIEAAEQILKLNAESGMLLQMETPELFHPMVQEFINTSRNHLLFRYNKSLRSKGQLRNTLFNALSFVTMLSPMQVKKMNVNSIDAGTNDRPAFKIRLKMYDSSVAYIILNFEPQKEHSILIEYELGNFTFDLLNNHVENIHGMKFESDPVNDNDLISKSLEAFALNIIFNKQPRFTFYHYTLVTQYLHKLENILQHSF